MNASAHQGPVLSGSKGPLPYAGPQQYPCPSIVPYQDSSDMMAAIVPMMTMMLMFAIILPLFKGITG